MRPIKLTMQAFGPYIDECEINFSEFGDRGLYLLTGNTGAGKTTIFDAITYALYGEMSGDNRESSMMRSKYASPTDETFVELLFECRGACYKIRRNLAFIREKKRGSDTTKQAASVTLTLPDGKTIEKGVNDKIENEILMLNRKQFCQTVMIAQGEYFKLLFAKSKEREPLLRTLFGTEKYKLLQERLNENKRTLEMECKQIRHDILSDSAWIKFDDMPELKSIAEDHAAAANTKQLIEIVEQLVCAGDSKQKALEKEKETVSAKHEAAIKSYQHTKESSDRLKAANETAEKLKHKIEKLQKDADDLTAEKKSLSEKCGRIDAEQEQLKDAPALLEKCKAEEEKAEGRLADAKALSNQMKNLTAAKMDADKKMRKAEECAKQKAALVNKQEELLAETETLRKRVADLDGETAKYTDLLNNREKTEKEISSLESLYAEYLALEKERQKLADAQKALVSADAAYSKINGHYEDLNSRFIKGQAGILGEMLEEGKECPVCGSKLHPNIAVRDSNVPTETELNAAKKKRDKAEEERSKAGSAATERKGICDTAEKKLSQTADELLGTHTDIADNIAKRTAECRDRMASLDQEIKQAKALVDERKQMQKQAEEKHSASEQLGKAIKDAETTCTAANSELNEAKGKYTQMENDLAVKLEQYFGDKSLDGAEDKIHQLIADAQKMLDQAKDAVTSEKKRIKKSEMLAEERKKLDQTAKEYDERSAALKEQIASESAVRKDKETEIQKLLNDPEFDGTPEQLAEKEAAVNAVKKRKNEIDTDLSSLENRIRDNRKAAASLKEKGTALAYAESQYTMVEELENTASGTVVGQDKITFETYVLQENFRGMVNHANRLFREMTDDHYTLSTAVQEKKSQKAGLDLELFDHWNDTSRDVKTLSGGESFLAALSLALGMAEEVQSSKGGVQIDSMFVDEGFGSLDEESLDLVMNALDELSRGSGSRLIGIISHVEELKNRIDKKIVISKDPIGGSKAEISV